MNISIELIGRGYSKYFDYVSRDKKYHFFFVSRLYLTRQDTQQTTIAALRNRSTRVPLYNYKITLTEE
jgi:hypothetical protein